MLFCSPSKCSSGEFLDFVVSHLNSARRSRLRKRLSEPKPILEKTSAADGSGYERFR